MKRFCSFCGKLIECDCRYSDYALMKLGERPSKGRVTSFDACPDCLNLVVKAIDSIKKKS